MFTIFDDRPRVYTTGVPQREQNARVSPVASSLKRVSCLSPALATPEPPAPTADTRGIGRAMPPPAGPRMVVPRPECWNADLDLHPAAQALPCGDARWRFAERFHRNPAHVAPPGVTIARL